MEPSTPQITMPVSFTCLDEQGGLRDGTNNANGALGALLSACKTYEMKTLLCTPWRSDGSTRIPSPTARPIPCLTARQSPSPTQRHTTGGGAKAVRAMVGGGLAPAVAPHNRVRVRFALRDSSPTRLEEVGGGRGVARW
jgi:hypothetical protein